MIFQEKMDSIVTHWKDYPIAEEFMQQDDVILMGTIEGIQKQIENLPDGLQSIKVVTSDENGSIKIETISLFKG